MTDKAFVNRARFVCNLVLAYGQTSAVDVILGRPLAVRRLVLHDTHTAGFHCAIDVVA